jgi:hypothetical protein
MKITSIFHCKTPDRFLEVYGCTAGEAYTLNGFKHLSTCGCAAYKYSSQRHQAKHRFIDWQITFPEWMKIWHESGNFGESGYVMARNGDVGPYAPWNVKIKTRSENTREWFCDNRLSWAHFESMLRQSTLDFYLSKTK